MLILAFDTSLDLCSVALWRDGDVLSSASHNMARGHSEALIPMLTSAMAQAGLDFRALDRIAVTTGPGSFTGVRIGLAAARGLALGSDVPLIGVTTPAVAAFAARDEAGERAIAAVVDSGRAEVFIQIFHPDMSEITAIAALAPEAASRFIPDVPTLVAGNGGPRIAPYAENRKNLGLSRDPKIPDAIPVAALAATLPLPEEPVSAVYIHPHYAKLPQGE
jgi:tRNA threonylcarbamoyladenosine biosynthesis protein TsaB